MIETLETEINGNIYTVTQMTARKALRMQAKLLKLLGPAASVILLACSKSKEENGEISTEVDNAIPLAVTHLVDQLDDKTFDALVMELIQGVRKNNVELTPPIFDLEFSGDLNTLFILLKFILEVNFSGFFQEGGILSMLLPAKKENANTAEFTKN